MKINDSGNVPSANLNHQPKPPTNHCLPNSSQLFRQKIRDLRLVVELEEYPRPPDRVSPKFDGRHESSCAFIFVSQNMVNFGGKNGWISGSCSDS